MHRANHFLTKNDRIYDLSPFSDVSQIGEVDGLPSRGKGKYLVLRYVAWDSTALRRNPRAASFDSLSDGEQHLLQCLSHRRTRLGVHPVEDVPKL